MYRFRMLRPSGYAFVTGLLMLLVRERRVVVIVVVAAAIAVTANVAATTTTEKPEFQNKVPVKLVWAIEGEDVELPCDITPPRPNDTVDMVLWFKDNAGIPLYSLDARNGNVGTAVHWAVSDDLGRRTYFQVADGHRAKLKITKVTHKDQGVFRCRVDFMHSPTRNFRVNLTLVEEPSKPVIYDAQGREVIGMGRPFLEGYNLLLVCQVSGGRPKPVVTWWKDGELLDGVVDVESPGVSSKFTVNHLFINKITRSLWGAKLECRAQSLPMPKPIVREVPLDVYLKPAVVKIVLSEDQIYAGRPLAARCETWGSSPAARIVWWLDGHVIGDPNVSTTQRSNSTVSKLALVLGKDDDGKELTCKAENPRFPGGVLKETRILRVAYAPIVEAHFATGYVLDTIREGDDLKLVCNVQSNPPPTIVVWYRDNIRLDHDVSAGILISSNTLTIRVLSLEHAGEYSCRAMNSVGEGHSPPLFVHMKYTPRCRAGYEIQEITAGHHEPVTLRCEVDAVPGEISKFSWAFNGTHGDPLPMPNSRAQNKGLVSLLEYTPIVDMDYGTLICWANNEIGRQRIPCIFKIVPAKAPEPPIDCTLHNESSALEVNCNPGLDGGSPQHFLLEVRGSLRNSGVLQVIPQTLQTPQSDQGAVGEAPPIYQERNPKPTFQLHDLEPGFDYTLYVYAVNGRGRSEPALLEHVRVAEPVGGKPERSGVFLEDLKKAIPRASSESMLILIALIDDGVVRSFDQSSFLIEGAAALILVGIGVIIGVVICRKRANTAALEGSDDFTTPTYVPAQRIEPRVRYATDRRSQRTSLYIEENRNDNFQDN